VWNDIQSFLHDHRGWVIFFSLILGVYYGRILVLGIIADHKAKNFKGETTKPVSPLSAQPVKAVKRSQDDIKTEIQPSMLEIGAAARLSKAVAQTAKMTPIQDQPNSGTTRETPRRQVDDKISQFFAKADADTPKPGAIHSPSTAETIKATHPPAPPSSAPELDVVLARLDKVLNADKGPDAPKPTASSDKKPIWASPEAFDDDLDEKKLEDGGKQLGLFDKTDDKK
jgi:hypothetical protein